MDIAHKNILIVTNSGNRGGMEVHVLDILEGLGGAFNFFVACPNGNIVDEYSKYAKIFNIFPKLDIDPVYISSLIKIIRENSISVVHAHELKAIINTLIAATICGVPLKITHQHTPISEWQISGIKKFIDVLFYKFFVNNFSSVEIALTEIIKAQKIKEGIKPQKLVVVPNGVNLSNCKFTFDEKNKAREEILKKYGIPKTSLIIGNISRLSIEKGHKVLIDAINLLGRNIEGVKIIIAGGGDLRSYLEEISKSYSLEKNVIFTGEVSEEEKKKLFLSFDIFVFPSRAEGFGIVLMEALAFGLPCIVSDLDVLKEVAGQSVLYFKSGDYEDLSKVIKMLLYDEKYRKNLSEKALIRSNNYNIQKFWESYNSLYTTEGTKN